ncbi:RNA 2',3'-cyclic phosphodiesterase [Thioalkalicoccus limnaeus]|uniref:RNA 2',3'-cyclic phosphodiesterase n=1 Tax=Thioalkalicoccus limnaeus TaxID=120681 RepID=A0ABV4BDF8_9GAMM
MSERLFFALWPDPSARAHLIRLVRSRVPVAARPTHPADLHLTLAFIGPLAGTARVCALEVAGAVRMAPFGFELDRIGHWPGPRVLWCGPAGVPDALELLATRLITGLIHCGVAADRRPFQPHVTLGRRIGALGHPESPSALARPIHWRATDFVLAASGGGGPPRYRWLRRWPLQP